MCLVPVMTDIPDDLDACPLCKQGHFARRDEEIVFLQWTERGPVRCRVTIPVAVCGQCGFSTWDENAERLINEAVHRERDKLP